MHALFIGREHQKGGQKASGQSLEIGEEGREFLSLSEAGRARLQDELVVSPTCASLAGTAKGQVEKLMCSHRHCTVTAVKVRVGLTEL